MADIKDKKVAIVCDWLTGIGGAERVVFELHKMFPEAPIYTSQYNPGAINWFKGADVRTTWLQKIPSRFKKFLPLLRAVSFSRLDLSDYDLVISSSGAEAKAVKTGRDTKHIWYCHAPTHYYWSRYESYMQEPGFGRLDWLARLALALLVKPLRRWDFKAAQRPNIVIANSTYTSQKIKQYYKRESVVIYPPVDTTRFSTNTSTNKNNFVVTGRQTPYKRIDLAVEACSKLGLPLVVIGNGPEHAKLTQMAGSSITFITNATDSDVAQQLQSARAFIFPGIDDFGIAAVEALAAGAPVIAYKGGGALDYISEGVNGLFFAEQTVASLIKSLNYFQGQSFSVKNVQSSADNFSVKKFQHTMRTLMARGLV